MGAHSELGASSAHRWLYCTASAFREPDFGIASSSSYADEGTDAHEMAEKILKGDSLGGIYLTEMFDNVMVYVDYVRSLYKHSAGDVLLIEEKVHYSDWVRDGFGTADAIIVSGDTLRVIDLKYGKGIAVSAENNPQLMLYALGAYSLLKDFFDIKYVTMTIVQPRLDTISEWGFGEKIPITNLLEFGEFAKITSEDIYSGKTKYVSSEKICKWCKSKASCQELARVTRKNTIDLFDYEIEKIEPDQMSETLSAKRLILGYIDAIESYAKNKIASGEGFPGFKLVEGKSTRTWADPEAVEKILKDDLKDGAYKSTLITAPTYEKLVGKKNINPTIAAYIKKTKGAPTLVQESDPRQSIIASPMDFELLDDDY